MIWAWLIALGAGATTVSLDNGVGRDYLSSQLATDGHLDAAKTLTGALSYGYSRLRESEGDISDVTNTFGGALSYMPERMQFRLGASIASTPEEKLTTRGMSFDGGYRGSVWKWKAGVGGTFYSEGYSGTTVTKKGKTRATTGTENLQQRFLRFDLRAKALAWLTLRSTLTAYGYGRNVAAFEANLDTPAAIRRGMDGFGGVVGGLPASSLLLEAAADLNDEWDVTLTHTISRLAVGGGQRSFVTRLVAGVDLNPAWHLDFGLERDQSPSFADTLGLIGVDVTF